MSEYSGSSCQKQHRNKSTTIVSQRWVLVAQAAVAVSILTAGMASAVEPFVASNNLGRINGTELQQRTGNSVQAVCGGFLGEDSAEMESRTELQGRLFARCGEMVHTNNRIQDNGGPVARDLGINETELNAALQSIAGEEIAAAGSLATESAIGQSNSINTRFTAILSRVTKLQVSSLNPQGSNGLLVASDESFSAGGGNAGDDDFTSGIPLGLFVNVIGGTADRDVTDGEDGFDADASGVTVGGEYRVKSNLVVGLAVGLENTDVDFRTSATVAGGGLESDQTNVTAYGLYFKGNSYVDVALGFGSGTYDLERRITIPDSTSATGTFNDTAIASTDSSSVRFSVGVGTESTNGIFTGAPFARLSYLNLDIDGYEESGAEELNLNVRSQSIDSVALGLGARILATISTSRAIVLPQVSVEWVHEYSDSRRQIVSSYVHDPRGNLLTLVTDSPDRDYATVGFGVSAVFRGGFQAFAEVKSLLTLKDIDQTILAGGLRYEF